jgi:regulator of nucleoside diphosphate kinase
MKSSGFTKQEFKYNYKAERIVDVPRSVFITSADKSRLLKFISREREFGGGDSENLIDLECEIKRATLTSAKEIPKDVVTMHSRVWLQDLDSGENVFYTLVYPAEADLSEGRISVLAPVGTAILGYRVGDVVEWAVPGGTVRYRIEKVLFQPEADGKLFR